MVSSRCRKWTDAGPGLLSSLPSRWDGDLSEGLMNLAQRYRIEGSPLQPGIISPPLLGTAGGRKAGVV